MMMNKIYYKELQGKKRFFTINLESDVTKEKIEKIGFLIRCFSNKLENKTFVCSENEFKIIKKGQINPVYNVKLYDYYEINFIYNFSNLPSGSLVFIDDTPVLKNSKGDFDVFSLATKQVDNEIINDNTVFSGRKEYLREKDSISIEERDRRLIDRDKELNTPLNDNECSMYLKILQKSQHVLPYCENELLEGDTK
jgi:hypothetical protein